MLLGTGGQAKPLQVAQEQHVILLGTCERQEPLQAMQEQQRRLLSIGGPSESRQTTTSSSSCYSCPASS